MFVCIDQLLTSISITDLINILMGVLITGTWLNNETAITSLGCISSLQHTLSRYNLSLLLDYRKFNQIRKTINLAIINY